MLLRSGRLCRALSAEQSTFIVYKSASDSTLIPCTASTTSAGICRHTALDAEALMLAGIFNPFLSHHLPPSSHRALPGGNRKPVSPKQIYTVMQPSAVPELQEVHIPSESARTLLLNFKAKLCASEIQMQRMSCCLIGRTCRCLCGSQDPVGPAPCFERRPCGWPAHDFCGRLPGC